MSLAAHLEMPQGQPGPAASTEELEDYLEACRPMYDRAKARLAGTDEEYLPRQQALRIQLNRAILSFGQEDPASKAVYLIGKAQGIIEELEAPRLIVAKFEQLKRQIEGV